MRFICLLILLVLLTALGVFAWQNRGDVTINFLDQGTALPMAAVIAAGYVAGMFSGWSIVGLVRRSLHRVTEPARR